jgi:hypothetical protein
MAGRKKKTSYKASEFRRDVTDAPKISAAEAAELEKTAVRPESSASRRTWKGHNFRYGPNNIWYLDSDNAATDYCNTGVPWAFPPSPNRSWRAVAGYCGPLQQYRKAEVTW